MKAGGELSWHYHEDCGEIIEVKEGTFYDAYSDKTYEKGDTVSYCSGVRHSPTALSDCVLEVTLIKDP